MSISNSLLKSLGNILRIPSEDVDDNVVLCYFVLRMSLLQFSMEWSVLSGLLHRFFLPILYSWAAHLQQLDFLSVLVNYPRANPVGLDVGGIGKQWDVNICKYSIVFVHCFWLRLGTPGRCCCDEV